MDVNKVNVTVIGGHSGVTILPLLSQVPGVTFSDEEHEKLTKRIQDAGTEVVDAKAGAGSATLSMAYAALRFVDALIAGLSDHKTVTCAYVKVEGREVEYFAGPVVIGKDGVEYISPVPDNLNAKEKAQLNEVYHTLKDNIQKGVEFVSKL